MDPPVDKLGRNVTRARHFLRAFPILAFPDSLIDRARIWAGIRYTYMYVYRAVATRVRLFEFIEQKLLTAWAPLSRFLAFLYVLRDLWIPLFISSSDSCLDSNRTLITEHA